MSLARRRGALNGYTQNIATGRTTWNANLTVTAGASPLVSHRGEYKYQFEPYSPSRKEHKYRRPTNHRNSLIIAVVVVTFIISIIVNSAYFKGHRLANAPQSSMNNQRYVICMKISTSCGQ
jgi:hypothetical protein